MFDIYVIESGDQWYAGSKPLRFGSTNEAQLFRNPEKAKATIRRAIRELELERKRDPQYFRQEKLDEWLAAVVRKVEVFGLTTI